MSPDSFGVRRVLFVAFVFALAAGMTVTPALGDSQQALRQPSVETGPATDVTISSATLSGNVTDLGGAENGTVWFRYWERGNRSETVAFAGVQVVGGNETFDASVTGLRRNTTYVYVAYVETDAGTASGVERTVTTDANATVEVDTRSARDVTDVSATLVGGLERLESAANATVSFSYWVQGNRSGTLARTEAATLSETGEFSLRADGLEPNTTYVAEAHANASGMTDTGDPVLFRTETDDDPEVETLAADVRDDDAATLRGNLSDLGGARNATVEFTYWERGDRDDTEATVTAGMVTETGRFNATVSGLDNETTYVYVATVTGADGDGDVGDQVEFDAAADERPVVETEDATDVAADAATLAGDLERIGAANATVEFTYWVQGDRDDTETTVEVGTFDDPGGFDARVTGLDSNTTYVYVATATAADREGDTGSPVTFTTETDDEREDGNDGDQRGPGDEEGPGNEYGPGDEDGNGTEYGPGDEYGQGDEFGPGDEHGPGDERGPGGESGPGDGHGPENAGPEAPGKDEDGEDDESGDGEDGEDDEAHEDEDDEAHEDDK